MRLSYMHLNCNYLFDLVVKIGLHFTHNYHSLPTLILMIQGIPSAKWWLILDQVLWFLFVISGDDCDIGVFATGVLSLFHVDAVH